MSAESPEAPEVEPLVTIVRRERASLVAIARAEGLSPEDALECVQDALVTFLARDPAESDHPEATLRVMVRNAARNERRKRLRRARLAPLVTEVDPASDDAFVDELLVHAEEVLRLRLCVAELCETKRAVVMLRLLDERSGEDVAATLGVTRNHVDVLVHRARAALHGCMRGARR